MPKPSLQSRINFFVNLLRGGMAFPKANRLTKERIGVGLPVNLQSIIGREYREKFTRSTLSFNARSSGRLRRRDAQELPFKSPIGYRYMINVSFRVYDSLTGSERWEQTNYGFHTLMTKNEILRLINERLSFMSKNSERYFSIPQAEIDQDSITLNSFVRFTG